MNRTTTSWSTREYSASQSGYTTTEIWIDPTGENLIPPISDAPQSPVEAILVLTVIDGEARVVKDESPPGARLPDPASGLFKLANASTLMDSPA